MAELYAACVGGFYEDLAERLVEGARARVRRRRARTVEVHEVPGAFELPLAAKYCADSGRYAGRRLPRRGDPRRDRPLRLRLRRGGRAGSRACQLDTGVPCAFGVLTVDNMEQALARVGGGKRHQGEDAARAVLRMAAAVRARADALINLYSDTQTRPTAAMREAIASAEVADEQRRQDPTTLRLEERVAELLGHEAARLHAERARCATRSRSGCTRARAGDEMILDRSAHPIIAEAGGPAMNASLMINPLDGDRGVFTAEQLRAAIRPESRYLPRSRLVSVEQTTNMGGGRVWPLETLQAVVEVARDARACARTWTAPA